MSSVEPEQYANQGDGGKKRVGELVVAGCDRAILLELAEEALNEVALAIQREVGLARLAEIGLRRNDRRDATLLERRDEGIGVIPLVGQQRIWKLIRRDVVEQWNGLLDVGSLTGRERQRGGIAERIDNGVNLGR